MRRIESGRWIVLAAALLAVFAAPACRQGPGAEELARFADEQSLARLAALPPDARLLLSFEGHEAMGPLPDLGENGRKLGSFGKTYLVLVDRAVVPDLLATPGLKAVVGWGGEKIVGKMDARVRLTMLSRVAGEELRATPVPVVARFGGDVLDLRHRLEKLGAEVHTANAGVVTMDAPVDVLFEILADSDLISIAKPMVMKPMGTMQVNPGEDDE